MRHMTFILALSVLVAGCDYEEAVLEAKNGLNDAVTAGDAALDTRLDSVESDSIDHTGRLTQLESENAQLRAKIDALAVALGGTFVEEEDGYSIAAVRLEEVVGEVTDARDVFGSLDERLDAVEAGGGGFDLRVGRIEAELGGSPGALPSDGLAESVLDAVTDEVVTARADGTALVDRLTALDGGTVYSALAYSDLRTQVETNSNAAAGHDATLAEHDVRLAALDGGSVYVQGGPFAAGSLANDVQDLATGYVTMQVEVDALDGVVAGPYAPPTPFTSLAGFVESTSQEVGMAQALADDLADELDGTQDTFPMSRLDALDGGSPYVSGGSSPLNTMASDLASNATATAAAQADATAALEEVSGTSDGVASSRIDALEDDSASLEQQIDAVELALDGRLAVLEALGIEGSDLAAWDAAVSWGDHAGAGYVQLITANTTLDVPVSFPDVNAALASLDGYAIASDVIVTIAVASGTNTTYTSPILPTHPNGDRIQILGDGTPILTFDGVNGVVVEDGNSLGLLDGVVIAGVNGASTGVSAIWASSLHLGPDVAVQGFSDTAVTALSASALDAAGVLASSNPGTGFVSSQGAYLLADDAIASSNGGHGFAASTGGVIVTDQGVAFDNTLNGLNASDNGTLSTCSFESTNNLGYQVSATTNAYVRLSCGSGVVISGAVQPNVYVTSAFDPGPGGALAPNNLNDDSAFVE